MPFPRIARDDVLDIGCNGGFYSIEMKSAGPTAWSVSIMTILSPGRPDLPLKCRAPISNFAGVGISGRQLREKFDLALFLGVLYHLRHPLLALDLLQEHVTRDLFVFQSISAAVPMKDGTRTIIRSPKRGNFEQQFSRMDFIEHGTPTIQRTGGSRIAPVRSHAPQRGLTRYSIIPKPRYSSAVRSPIHRWSRTLFTRPILKQIKGGRDVIEAVMLWNEPTTCLIGISA